MRGAYLCIFAHQGTSCQDRAREIAEHLVGKTRLSRVMERGRFQLLADASTPQTHIVGEQGVVVGDLFRSDGDMRSADTVELFGLNGYHPIQHLLRAYWGQYVALLVGADGNVMQILRDPSGAVPCFRAQIDDATLIFSDAAPLLEAGILKPQIDWSIVAQHLVQGPFRTSSTALQGIAEIAPGCSITLGAPAPSAREWWSPWHYAGRRMQLESRDAAVEQLRAVILACTSAWASKSPSALVELSGGLDSSIVAASLAHARADVCCVTLATADAAGDEREHATKVADHIGAPIEVRPLHVNALELDRISSARHLRPSTHLLSHVADGIFGAVGREKKVAGFFNGNGGDYVLGYLGTSAPLADLLISRGPGLSFLRGASDLATMYRTTFWRCAHLALKKAMRPRTTQSYRVAEFISPDMAATEFEIHPWLRQRGALPGKFEQVVALAAGQESFDRMLRETVAPVRQPLLSQPVVELCLQIPTWMCIAGGRNRAVARDAFAGLLPKAIVQRRTKGDLTNFVGSLYASNRAYLREFIMGGSLRDQGMLDDIALDRHFATSRAESDTASSRVMEIASVEAWARSWR